MSLKKDGVKVHNRAVGGISSKTATGKATRKAAFDWYKRQLALVGVTKLSKFIAVLHTMNNTKSATNIMALEAKREAERKAAGRSPRALRRSVV